MDHAVLLARKLRAFFVFGVFVAVGSVQAQQTSDSFVGLGTWPPMYFENQSPPSPAPPKEITWAFPNQAVSSPDAKWHQYVAAKGVSIQVWAIEFVDTKQIRPTAVLMRRTLYGSQITGTLNVNFYQTHIFVDSQLMSLSSPRTVTGTSTPFATTGGVDTTVNINAVVQAYSSIYSDPVVANRTGRFRMEISSSTNEGAVYQCEFIIKGGGLPGFDPDNPGQGGEGANSDDEGVQRGFWESLAMDICKPQQDSLDDLKEAAQQFAGWGPSGMLQDAIAELNTTQEGMGSSASLGLGFTPGNIHSTTVNLGWAQPVFGTMRAMLAFVVWFGVLYGGWRFVIKFMMS